LKVQNVAFWLFVPTFTARWAFNTDVEKRIENMWRTYRNRLDKGMSGTWKSDGHHESAKADRSFIIP